MNRFTFYFTAGAVGFLSLLILPWISSSGVESRHAITGSESDADSSQHSEQTGKLNIAPARTMNQSRAWSATEPTLSEQSNNRDDGAWITHREVRDLSAATADLVSSFGSSNLPVPSSFVLDPKEMLDPKEVLPDEDSRSIASNCGSLKNFQESQNDIWSDEIAQSDPEALGWTEEWCSGLESDSVPQIQPEPVEVPEPSMALYFVLWFWLFLFFGVTKRRNKK